MRSIKVVFSNYNLLPMLLTDETLPSWVWEQANHQQRDFLTGRRWAVDYSFPDKRVYLHIDIQDDRDETLANIYFG